jgi:serine/threonine-protein kinase
VTGASDVCPRCGTRYPRGRLSACPACLLDEDDGDTGALAVDAPPAGRVGPYELLGLLGQGGMARVYTAKDTRGGGRVALKLLPLAPLGDERKLGERLRREARTLARLRHPHIVALRGFGEDGAHAWIAMELVAGQPLSHEVPAAPERARAIALQVCDALAYAHARGIVHRDLKPGNVLIDRDGRVKVADFGIAGLVPGRGDDTRVTLDGTAVGTPAYMAPEALAGAAPDPRLDVYSLGVLLYELLTGHLPLGVFDLPGSPFDHVLVRALAQDPAERYPDILELRRDLLAEAGAGQAGPLPSFEAFLRSGAALALALATEMLLQAAANLRAPLDEVLPLALPGAAAALAGSLSSAWLFRRWRALGHVDRPPPADERGLVAQVAPADDAPLPWPLALVVGAALTACAAEIWGGLLPLEAARLLSHVGALLSLFAFWSDLLDTQRRAQRARSWSRDGLLFLGLGLVVASRLALGAS